MAIGFKKSLFGFNCTDVVEYIEKTHKTFVQKEKNLNSKVEELLGELNTAKEVQEKLEAEKLELDRKLNEFNQKYEEIERLSENIGKLYLVAQTNAQAIISNSEENAQLSKEEVNRNLYTIDEDHSSLAELRQHIAKTSDDFIAEVENMMASLTKTREQIAVNTESIDSAKKEFTEVYESIVG